MDAETFDATGPLWAAIEKGLAGAKRRGAVKAFSYDGDGTSGAVIVDMPDGSAFIVKIAEFWDDENEEDE